MAPEGGESATSFSLSPLGPSWGNQGRVIPRSLDKFGAEPSRAPAQPLPCAPLPRKGLDLWAGSLRWVSTGCFLHVEPPLPFPKPSRASSQGVPLLTPVVSLLRSSPAPHICRGFLGSAEQLDRGESHSSGQPRKPCQRGQEQREQEQDSGVRGAPVDRWGHIRRTQPTRASPGNAWERGKRVRGLGMAPHRLA